MEIQEIKKRLSIHTVLKHYGLQPDRNNMLKCPFHEDETASMKIYPQTNTFNCFGCNKNGDAIEFCTLKEGSKHKGILKAAELCGLSAEACATAKALGDTLSAKAEEIQPINNKPKQPKQNHIETLTKFFAYFQNNLNHPVAIKPKEYLKRRNLNYELLEIGYNSGQFHHRGKLDEADTKECVNVGLLIPYKGSVPNGTGTTYTTFAKDCIIFPLKNNQNPVCLSVPFQCLAKSPDFVIVKS